MTTIKRKRRLGSGKRRDCGHQLFVAGLLLVTAVGTRPTVQSFSTLCAHRKQESRPLHLFHASSYKYKYLPLRSSASSNTTDEIPHLEERFSVAPMMAHTNRHYHYYFRHFSSYATLYTEMIPASQIVQAFQQHFNMRGKSTLSVEQVLDLLAQQGQQGQQSAATPHSPLQSLLHMAKLPTQVQQRHAGPIVLQLGGRDPHQLALATAIGSYIGYQGINLNCGCPSNAVSGGARSGGLALMREPSVAASCLEAMSCAIDQATTTSSKPALSVKHRLGVHDAATYDAHLDRLQPDDEAFRQCRDFVRAATLGADISKIQVHARLGLVGNFDDLTTDSSQTRASSSLWVPGAPAGTIHNGKVDHKRLQYRAKQTARQATIQNRSIPPLRPNVVEQIAAEFPHLDVISNGGIRSMNDIEQRVPRTESSIMGAMVGRAVINHPCAFGNADTLWEHDEDSIELTRPTRESVILDLMEYCQREEELFLAGTESIQRRGDRILESLANLRRRLVAVPFHLFAGEKGNAEYQRRMQKLIARAERHSSSAILAAALSVVPPETACKPVNQYASETKDIPAFQSPRRRSGPLQRTIS
jgi:tRNA-dihydrouridine synthase